MVKKRKPWIPTTAVKGPGAGPPPYWTRVLEMYAASTMPVAAKPRDARRSVSRSMSPSPISCSTTWTYFLRGFTRSVVSMSL